MGAAARVEMRMTPRAEMQVEFIQAHWYAAYTCANHEKSVAGQLAGRGVEHLLPQYEVVHRWKDRRMRVSLPLFPGYVFVKVALRDKLRVLAVSGVVRLIGFGEYPAALPEQEIEFLRSGAASQLHLQPHPYLTAGRRVRILRGPLAGLEGILQRKKGNLRIVLQIDLLQRAMAVDVDAADILPLGCRETTRVARPAEAAGESRGD